MVARLSFPLAYNYLRLLRIPDTDTTYGRLFGRPISAAPIIGDGFVTYFPLLVLVLAVLQLTNMYQKVITWLGLQDVLEFEDSGMKHDEAVVDEGQRLIKLERLKRDIPPVDLYGNIEEDDLSADDGTLCHKQTGISIGQNGLKDGQREFSIDPEDIEVDDDDCILGRGACGIVTKAVHARTGTWLAIKAVRVEDKEKRAQLMTDIQAGIFRVRKDTLGIQALIMAQKCEFLVQLYAAYVHKASGCVHVALELMDRGSLEDFTKKIPGKVWPERMLAIAMWQTVEGIRHLHCHHALHRDIKPGNILINSRGQCVCQGTATYMSPERAIGQDYTYPADIWSVGMVVYELATGRYPFSSINSFPALFDWLCNKDPPSLDSHLFSPELCEFVSQTLVKDPGSRASADDLLKGSWLGPIASGDHEAVRRELSEWMASILSSGDTTHL
ncbi:mitogen-activated protein kinase kinase [Perkinsus chesapeaki]|uniref:mitogen-activated protein kinase kinase n=1 Tax=Perkinsus chesapeaki TaxID=330153 RepID=A0A7J6MM81_PERCH|nr:mitogen-activated protein kinase kinase [Perkinsus chesapeaki]